MSSKIKLHLAPVNGGSFNCLPAREIELEDEKVLCNNVVLPGDFNPHTCKLWVVGHELGAVGAVWADCEQDALDELIDSGLGDSFLIDKHDFDAMDEHEREDVAYLGNASEPCNLDNAWIQAVEFKPERDWKLLCQFAEARGNCSKSLYF
jgi:hypothetical protein